MESAGVLRSFHYSVGVLNLRSSLEKPGILPVHNATWSTSSKCSIQGLTVGWKLLSPAMKREGTVVSCAKASASTAMAKSDASVPQGSLEKSALQGATFPSGFVALILEVCDETQIAELKLKVGDFQMHLKRNIKAPIAVAYPVAPPPVPSKPIVESTPTAPASSPPKTSSGKINPFTNVPVEKSRKLAALEASGASGYVLVASPTVGSFRKGRTLKGKKQPPSCKAGDLIKEGQVIGFLDQFGTELPVKSDVAGEVLKLLFDDGGQNVNNAASGKIIAKDHNVDNANILRKGTDISRQCPPHMNKAVGYGDPLIAVLPSFYGIK